MPRIYEPDDPESPLNKPVKPRSRPLRTPDRDKRLVDQVMRRFDNDRTGSVKWRTQARRAYRYYESKQAPAELDGQATDNLYVVLNITHGRIEQKHGILTSANPQPEVMGRGMEDDEVAEVFRDLLSYRTDQEMFDAKRNDAVLDMLVGGVGVLEEEYTLEEEQITTHGKVDGNLRLSVGDALRYYVDADNRTWMFWGKYGPRWYTVEDFVSVDDLCKQYPRSKNRIKALRKKKGSGATGSGGSGTSEAETGPRFDRATGGAGEERSDTDTDQDVRGAEDKVQHLTHWYAVTEPKEIVLYTTEDGYSEPAMMPDGKLMASNDIPEGEADQYEVVVALKRKIRTLAIAGGSVLLYDKPSPYKHGRWPATFFCGTMHQDQPMPYGEVQRLFDIQDLFNKLSSLLFEHGIRGARSGGRYPKGAFDDSTEEAAFKATAADPGTWHGISPEYIDMFREWQSVAPPAGLFQLQQDIRVLADEVSSLYNSQRGGMPYDTSGRGIIALQQAGDVALTQLKTHIEYGCTDWGQKAVSNAQQFWTWERAFRISDKAKDVVQQYITEIHPNPDDDDNPALALFRLDSEPNPETGIPMPKAVPVINDLSVGEFDVRYRIGSAFNRSPEAKQKEADAIYGAMSGLAPRTALEYLLEALEVPNRRGLLKKVDAEVTTRTQPAPQAMMPPGLPGGPPATVPEPAMEGPVPAQPIPPEMVPATV